MFGASWREFSAEFLGTFVLMVFGLGVNAQVSLGGDAYGTWLSINIGWGLAVVMGVYVAGGVTGAHINPAVTIGLFSRGAFPAKKVIPFIVAQMAGAFVASVVVFAVYFEALNYHDFQTTSASAAEMESGRSMKTAGIWATYPREFADGQSVSNVGGFFDQVLGTALLLLCICAISDKKNLSPQSNLGPIVVGAVVFLIGMTFGSNAGYAINPARDLGPRLFTFIGGWGTKVFETPNGFWWLVPIVGPCLGGVLGVWIYKRFIEDLHSSEDTLPRIEEGK